MENYIKEAKRGFSIDRIATGDFAANEMDLLVKLLATTCMCGLNMTVANRFIKGTRSHGFV